MAVIEVSLLVAAPPDRCFDLARSIDAHMHSAAATGERAVGHRISGLLGLHEEVTWRARHLGVWQELTSRITVFDPPRHFRDSMVRGAFACFDHDHYFVPAQGQTLMRDVFVYRAPLGPFGRLAEALFLTRYMRRFLTTRLYELKALAESDKWDTYIAPAS